MADQKKRKTSKVVDFTGAARSSDDEVQAAVVRPFEDWIAELADLSDETIDECDPALFGSFRDAARELIKARASR